MTMQGFIDEHRGELDAYIRNALVSPNFDLNDSERELWIANDQGLYLWAAGEGVDLSKDDDEEGETAP